MNVLKFALPLIVLSAIPAFAAGPNVITLTNNTASAVIFFSAGPDANLLKDALAPGKSIKVNIGKSCKVQIAIDFEDGDSLELRAHDFCVDKVLKLKAMKDE
jgi:sporulation-control protein spo0M